ncbi:MAG: tetratricopeptide repeat protein [Legionellaceae bacterium]|nr:tetratricopeptide repeat protein [Legionellaceae bacterium]
MSENLNILLEKAIALQQDNQISEAIGVYQQLLKIDPNYVDGLRYLALCYVQSGESNKAIATFLQALSLKNDPIFHMNLGNIYKRMQNIEKAVYHYQQAIEINPKYAKAHNNLAGLYAGLGNYKQALVEYKEALHSDPSFTLAHLNLGILFFKNQQIVAAETQFNNVLSLDIDNITAQFYLGILLLGKNELDRADILFEKILLKEPEHVETLVNLGVIALKKGKDQSAIDFFTKALILDETNIEARNNLAATFIHNDRYENALMYYDQLLKDNPNNVEYLYNTAVAQMGLGHVGDAEKFFNTVLNLDSKHFGALSNLAAIKMRRGDKQGACVLLERAVAVNPDEKTTQFMLAAISENHHSDTPYCPSYANDLFNHYAMYYEKHMQDTLQYNIPKKLWDVLHQLNVKQVDKALDLGCGTGLSGEVLKNFCRHLIGVDISQKMLSIANSKDIFDKLIEAEALTFIKEDIEIYQLIVAADVLPYFASLDELFISLKPRLSQDGFFIFTAEISDSEPWVLQETIRYSHNPNYIGGLCEKYGYKVEYEEKTIARKHEDSNLEVMLYVISFD